MRHSTIVGIFTVMLTLVPGLVFAENVIDDSSLFPLQPREPVIPFIVILMSVYVLWRGAGAWSLDLRATQAAA